MEQESAWFVEGDYVDHDGVRHVRPYHSTLSSKCKPAWVHRQLLEVYTTTFDCFSPAHYALAFAHGHIHANGKSVTDAYVVQRNDILSHTFHRHELPVLR